MTAESRSWWADEPDPDLTETRLSEAALAGEGVRANGNPISGVPATGSGWPGEMPTGAVPTTPVRPDALPDTAPSPSRTMPDERSHPGRLVFGLAMLAAERVRPGAGANPALLT